LDEVEEEEFVSFDEGFEFRKNVGLEVKGDCEFGELVEAEN
jgi:hypothetical protein